MSTEQPKVGKPAGKTKRAHDPGFLGPVKVFVDIIDFSTKDNQLPVEMPVRLAEECSNFVDFTMLEPMGIAFISHPDGCLRLRRHRVVLVVQAQRLSEVIGHVRAYCQTVLEGHPVMFEIERAGFLS